MQCWDVALKHGVETVWCFQQFVRPVQIGLMPRKIDNEKVQFHTHFVNTQGTNLVFDVANRGNLLAQFVAQFVHGFCGEANTHQLGSHRILRFVVRIGAIAIFVKSDTHFVK